MFFSEQRAQEWIRNKKDAFDEKLKKVKGEHGQDKCSAIERTISVIDKFVVASVALDSSAVFTTKSAESSLAMPILRQRISVKLKAVEALAEDGVDISNYIPKTANELLLLLDGNQRFKRDLQISDDYHKIPAIECNTQEEKSHLDGPLIDNELSDGNNIRIDRLIVLCSCGDDMKYNLMQCSKYVEEWDIEPPTAAANAGEGDGAYRRVSLEIRDEVNCMMESLLGTSLE